jgi:hypothetical protein
VDQSGLEFLIPAEHNTYVDPNIHLYFLGKLTKADGSDLYDKDLTAVMIMFLYLLFSQCSVTLNGVTATQATEIYHYRIYHEILLTYDSDTSASHLTNAYWYLHDGNTILCYPISTAEANTKAL